ncbi:MAG: ABC transporter permease [Alistipes sp.]|nr:ABC transporter permease [Rikenellaceae bacterium]MBO5331127.1 ABC transporter permease [Alistipes sp.]MBP3600823.1 ABC transporter permease [Alistipes sp.]
MNKIGIIIAREFNERVKKKSFIITTILMPLLMIGMMAAPTLMMLFAKGEQKTLLVIDESSVVAPQLEGNEDVEFKTVDAALEEARKDMDVFGVLWIGENIVDSPSDVKLYTNSSSSMSLEESITAQIEKVIERERLKRYDIDNLEDIMKDLKASVTMTTYRNDQSEEGKDEQATSSVVSYLLGLVLGMMLYMFLIIYGSMVMTSVIEEKGSRVLDVLVSSVSPFQLMMGKILGVAAVAVTQIAIWGVLVCGIGSAVLPALMPDDVMQSVEAVQAGQMTLEEADMDAETISALSLATDMSGLVMMFVWLLLFLLGGFLFYSAMFAAVGSAVDSIQDANQLQTPITVPIILALILAMSVFNDPNSPLAFWGSIIPFTSPVVMMARIPFDIPTWQIVLSLVLLYASVAGMAWVAGKIYRVGIFMHGKKPSFKELLSWVKQ